MKLSEALSFLERIRLRGGDPELLVMVQSEGGLGGTPAVATDPFLPRATSDTGGE